MELPDLIKRNLRFALKDDLVGDASLLTTLLVVGPGSWKI